MKRYGEMGSPCLQPRYSNKKLLYSFNTGMPTILQISDFMALTFEPRSKWTNISGCLKERYEDVKMRSYINRFTTPVHDLLMHCSS